MTQDQKEGRKQQRYWYFKCNLVLEEPFYSKKQNLVSHSMKDTIWGNARLGETDYRVTNQVWMWEERGGTYRSSR